MTEVERNELIAKLREEYDIEKIVEFNEFTIQSKLQNHSLVLIQYDELLEKAKFNYNKVVELRDKIVGQRYDYYRFESEKNLQKGEIEKYYLPRDEKILAINTHIERQKIIVDFFTICVKALGQQGWNMKHFLDSMTKI